MPHGLLEPPVDSSLYPHAVSAFLGSTFYTVRKSSSQASSSSSSAVVARVVVPVGLGNLLQIDLPLENWSQLIFTPGAVRSSRSLSKSVRIGAIIIQ